MAKLILGLDIGTTSIGWALVNQQDESVVHCGVRIFPEGVDRDTKGAEKSKNEQRRIARSHRRLLRRRSARKQNLRKILVEAGLLPEVALARRNDPERVAWEKAAFQQADPYLLRKTGLDKQLESHEFGRVLLHLNQRRGFLSNRKADRDRQKETEGMLGEISQLQADIDQHARTLGEYLANLRSDDPKEFHFIRMRSRHTRRSMYEDEFDLLWNQQQTYFPEKLTDELKATVHNEIFFQRPIKPPSPSIVGRCEVLPRQARCSRADRRANKFRLYLEVNNMKYIDMSRKEAMDLTPEQRSMLIDYLMTGKERTFDQIRKKLFPQQYNIRFNLEVGDRKRLQGMPIDAALAGNKLLGKSWREVDDSLKDWIVAAIIDDDEPVLERLLEQAGFDSELAELLLEKTPLASGYSSYSLPAINRLLPFVEQGMPLLSRDESTPCAYREAGFLPPWERESEKLQLLGDPPEVTNPIVRSALREIKKVVNAILREIIYKEEHELVAIRIELAREANGTAEKRAKYISQQRKNEQERKDAIQGIEQLGYSVTHDTILRYRLWQQQNKMCIYSGINISPQQLFGGEVDIDHILPYGRSLDNSQMNKVVCFRSENSLGASRNAKGDRTPYEWLAEANPEKYDEVIQRAKKLPYPKYKRFFQKELQLEDFIARQLQDTAYITTQVKLYLECLGAKIECVKGQQTSTLRRRWGLGTILQEMTDSPAWQAAQELPTGEKNRLDHRHHVIDAIVVALTDKKKLQALAEVDRWYRKAEFGFQPKPGFKERVNKKLSPICGKEVFRQHVVELISQINVSYRVRRKASGQLHEETIYGKTENEGEFVVRKDLTALTPSMVEDIRDPIVREKVLARLQEYGVEIGRGKTSIPKDVWAEPLWMNREKGVLINKVRLIRREQTIEPIREGTAYVKPGNTHHLCLFEYVDEQGQTKKVTHFVTMLEVMKRIRNKEQIIQRIHPDYPDAKFLFSLSGYEMLLIEHDGTEDLYRYSRSSSTSEQMWFKQHCAGGKAASKIGQISKKPNTLVAQKVTVDPIGRIRWAND